MRHVILALALGVMLTPLACSHQQPALPIHQSTTIHAKATLIPTHGKHARNKHQSGEVHTSATLIPLRNGTPAWNKLVDSRLKIGGSSGHGPKIGSPEWKQAVDKAASVDDGHGHGPTIGSDEWDRAVNFKVFGHR